MCVCIVGPEGRNEDRVGWYNSLHHSNMDKAGAQQATCDSSSITPPYGEPGPKGRWQESMQKETVIS